MCSLILPLFVFEWTDWIRRWRGVMCVCGQVARQAWGHVWTNVCSRTAGIWGSRQALWRSHKEPAGACCWFVHSASSCFCRGYCKELTETTSCKQEDQSWFSKSCSITAVVASTPGFAKLQEELLWPNGGISESTIVIESPSWIYADLSLCSQRNEWNDLLLLALFRSCQQQLFEREKRERIQFKWMIIYYCIAFLSHINRESSMDGRCWPFPSDVFLSLGALFVSNHISLPVSFLLLSDLEEAKNMRRCSDAMEPFSICFLQVLYLLGAMY